MTETEERFILALNKITGRNFEERDVVVTPFDGNYGRAGYIIVINGSPPKGMVVVQVEHGVCSLTAILDMFGRAKRIAPEHETRHLKRSSHRELREAVNTLLEPYLARPRSEPIEILDLSDLPLEKKTPLFP